MKKILFYLMTMGFAFYGKSQGNETNTGFKTPILPADYVKLDLSNIGLKATVIAPKQSETQKSYLDDNLLRNF